MTDPRRCNDSQVMASTTLPQSALAVAYPRMNTLRQPPANADRAYVPPALADVYETHFKYVWRCLKSLGVTEAALDDAVQEVFLVVQRKLSAFDGACDVRTWIYAIVLRIARRSRAEAARDARRFQRDTAQAPDSPADPDARRAPEQSADLRVEVEKQDQLALAQRALSYLDDNKREVFVLACVEGMSAPEIADIAGVPVNTVYSRLRAARHAFSEAVSHLQNPISDPQPASARNNP